MTVNNALSRGNGGQEKKQTFSGYMTSNAVKTKINEMMGKKEGEQFTTDIVAAVSTNKDLASCEFSSIFSCAVQGAGLKLSPSPQLGQYYMVPFKQKEKKDRNGNLIRPESKTAQFILGYKGYIQLAIRSGYYKKLNVISIKEGELVSYNPLDEEIIVNLIEDEVERENTPATGYYAMFEYNNGFKKTMYWSKEKMISHAESFSQAFKMNGGGEVLKQLEGGWTPEWRDAWKYSSFWFKDFDAMALKTMMRQLISKWGIMSIDMQNAIIADAEPEIPVDYFEENAPVEVIAEAVIEEEAPQEAAKEIEMQNQGIVLPQDVDPEPMVTASGQVSAVADPTAAFFN